MWRMKLAFTHHYPANPSEVAALLRNEAFLADVAQHAGAIAHSSSIGEDTTLSMTLPAPENARRFVGTTIPVRLVFTMAEPDEMGQVSGAVLLLVDGAPVEAGARVSLTPQGEHTVGQYDGDLTVRVPLVGRKVEQTVEPFVIDAFGGIQRRANDWLSR